jgi:hypothetical protein
MIPDHRSRAIVFNPNPVKMQKCKSLGARNEQFPMIDDSVLHHSRFGLASYEKLLDDLSEMAVPGSAGRFTCGKGCYQQLSRMRNFKAPAIVDLNPYRGVEHFDEAHAPFFFGREKFIDDLFNGLRERRKKLVVAIGDAEASVRSSRLPMNRLNSCPFPQKILVRPVIGHGSLERQLILSAPS